MCASNYNRFWDRARYLWKKSSFYHTPLAFDAPVRGFPSEYRHRLWYGKKLEWCRYPMVKKFRRYIYSFWRDPRTWRTDGQTLRDSIDRACIASRGKNHPVYELALAVMQRVLSLLVLQVAAYHGWRKFGTSGCTLSNQGRSSARWTRPSADFFVPLMIFLERLEGQPLKR